MANVKSILDQRMKKPSNTSKMAAMAKQSVTGNLTSFSGVFSIAELSIKEKEALENILKQYANESQDIQQDLEQILSLTAEVKAINNQAALLHGERIKKAHQLLIQYRDGAFTAWLMATYGNRQTPYNLMQYYEFCEAMPKALRPQIEWMPRQAVYVLASREGDLEQKQEIVENYQGETKAEILELIRQTFPLNEADLRQEKVGKSVVQELQKIYQKLEKQKPKLSFDQKQRIASLLKSIQQFIGETT